MTETPGKSSSKIAESIVGITWSIGTLIFFNFFSDYIAYYHDGIREPFVTADFGKWLWVHNPLLILLLIRYSISIVFKEYVFKESILIFLSLLSVASTAVLLSIFPFDFTILPSPDMAKWIDLGLRIAIIATIVMFSIEALIRILKLFRTRLQSS